MNIHEYQGKALLKAHGVPVLEGVHCTSVEDALNAYDSLGSKVVAVKSQIHAGGRGKGTLFNPATREHVMDGGVKIAFSKDEVQDLCNQHPRKSLWSPSKPGMKERSSATSTLRLDATLPTSITSQFW